MPSASSIKILYPALRSSSPSQARIPLSVVTLPSAANAFASAAFSFFSLLIILLLLFLKSFRNAPSSLSTISCISSASVSGCISNTPSRENPLYVPALISFQTSSFTMWNSAKREPSAHSSNPSTDTPSPLMKYCTICTPFTSLSFLCITLTSFCRLSARYFSAIIRIWSAL